MKRENQFLGVVVGCLLSGLANGGQGATERIDGVAWGYVVNGSTATVTNATPAVGELEIPGTLGGFPVTGIGKRAFQDCDDLTAVDIGDGMREIAYGAFAECDGLTSVRLPDSVTEISGHAFHSCRGLKTVDIGNGVTNIGISAFAGCDALTTVTLGEHLENIGVSAFAGCSSLKEVALPESVTSIGAAAFLGCNELTAMRIPGGVTQIGALAFHWCRHLAAATFGDAVTDIGSHAFSGCNALEEVTMGRNLATIGEWTFAGCDSLQTVYVPPTWGGSSRLAAIWLPPGCKIVVYRGMQVVTFNANEGVCGTETESYAIGSVYGPLPTATRENHVFGGWFTAAMGGEQVLVSSPVSEEAFRTLYAHWKIRQKVTFDANGGSCPTESETYTEGEPYGELPSTAVRTHYAFAGWFTAPDGGTQVTEESTVTSESTRTLYAHWRLVEQVVTFAGNGGDSSVESGVYAIGEFYSSLPSAVQDGYAFAGWFTTASGGEQVTSTSTVTTESTRTLYAHWKVRQTVAFDANGGSCSTATGTYTEGEPYGELPISATRDHYVFSGWFTEADGGAQVTKESIVTSESSRTLYAQWSLVEQVVTFAGNGGESGKERDIYRIGETYAVLPTAAWEGHVFAGWFTTIDGNMPVTEESTVTAEATRTLYAHWDALQTVMFDANGGSCPTATGTYIVGKIYGNLPTDAVRARHAFAGWFTAASGGTQVQDTSTVTAETTRTLYAHWVLGEQLVTYDAAGGVCETETASYLMGETYGVLPEAERENYSFEGWFTATNGGTQVTAESPVTAEETRTLYARWALQRQTVLFEVAGGHCEPSSTTYDVGIAYGNLPAATWEGCTFAGWFTEGVGGESVTEDSLVSSEETRTLHAHWTTIGQNGRVWSFGVSNGMVTVTGASPANGDLEIPSELAGHPVVEIGEGAFSGSGVTSVTIPDSVTVIGGRAFDLCRGLKTAVIGNDVVDIGGCAFRGCSGLTAVAIGNSVTNIDNSAFWGCTALKSVAIPASVELFGSIAFGSCNQLASMYKPAAWEGTERDLGTGGAPSSCKVVYYERLQQVVFDANGGNCDPAFEWHAAGWTYESLPTPTQSGYVFNGWYTAASGGTLVTAGNTVTTAEKRTLYAHWKAGKQTVTFDANGGECGTGTATFIVGENYADLPEATREGYAFVGWFTSARGGTQVRSSDTVTTEETRTVYAQWKIRQVVTFNPNGGSCPTETRGYIEGTLYDNLPVATRAHHSFVGWFTSANGGTQVTESTTVTTASKRTFYAHWAIVEQVVTFNASGGICDVSEGVFAVGNAYGSLPTPIPTWDNQLFVGWFTAATGETQVTAESVVTELASLVLYAHWSSEQTVTFEKNAGRYEVITTGTYSMGETYSSLPEITLEHFAFEGWYTEREGGEQITENSPVPVILERTLYAHWRSVELVVNFDANGGRCDVVQAAYPFGTVYGDLPLARWGGCTFEGWYGAGPGPVTEDTLVSLDNVSYQSGTGMPPTTTFYALWSAVGEDGQRWQFYGENGEIKLTEFLGMGGDVNVTIPSSLGGCPVTTIGSGTFWHFNRLTSVTIHEGIKHIEEGAFYHNLQTVLFVPASWEGTDILANAGVPEGCTVVYGGAE